MLRVVLLSVVMLSVIKLSVIMLSVVNLSVAMLSVIMLSVVMLSVVMLSVVVPNILHACFGSLEEYKKINGKKIPGLFPTLGKNKVLKTEKLHLCCNFTL